MYAYVGGAGHGRTGRGVSRGFVGSEAYTVCGPLQEKEYKIKKRKKGTGLKRGLCKLSVTSFLVSSLWWALGTQRRVAKGKVWSGGPKKWHRQVCREKAPWLRVEGRNEGFN